MLEPLLDLGQVQARGIGQQHELEERIPAQGADMHHRLECLAEPGREGRLAIAAQGHVAQLEQFIRQRAIPGTLAQTAPAHESQRLLQFRRHGFHVQRPLARFPVAVHFAIDALEVTVLVGAQVDADRQAAGARRDHRIDETVVQEIARGAERGFLAAVMPIRKLFPLLRWFG